MKYINPNVLQPGDIILTTSMSPLAALIRARTWPSFAKGFGGWFNMGLATHAAIVCDRGGGLYYACEMIGRGIEMSELEIYDHGPKSWLKHIIAVRRHTAFSGPGDDPLDRRIKANRYMIDTHSFNVRYGFDKLIEFIFPKAKDNPYTMICSQWARRVFAQAGIVPPFPDLCSPADWQNWKDLADIHVQP
jgi:hypothetical protein